MAERVKRKGGGLYYSEPTPEEFFPSGCTMLDRVLGGGWRLGRMGNIIGDKSTGKTLLAIEAVANFAMKYPKGDIFYREVESAFDKPYAQALGMPLKRVDFGTSQLDTVEDMDNDIRNILKDKQRANHSLYVVDSLDALTSREELARKVGEGSFGLEKQKHLGKFFRTHVRALEKANVTLLIISQIRDNIGAMFGDKTKRSGGHSMDFYGSQVIKLAHLKNLVSVRDGVKRATGIRIKVKCTKNKVGLPLRGCEFVIRFGYGVESLEASLDWLVEVKKTQYAGLTIAKAEEWADEAGGWDRTLFDERTALVDEAVKRAWLDIETSFLPQRKKYT